MSAQKVEILIPCRIAEGPSSIALSAKANELYSTSASISNIPCNQPDLLFMRSLLVSTGENANDDVFIPEEMWKARHTPILKPVDWEHNTGRELTPSERAENPKKVVVDNQTIGVMYNTYTIDENGATIDEDRASANDFEIPNNFHIIDESVIWKALYPTVASDIEEGAANGTLFVSMEAWFPDYCYLVGSKVVARNQETAFLDGSLRAHGGTGTYGNSRVKRVLRGMTFGGKGIVGRPANEPSVIMDVSHEPMSAQASTNKAIANNIMFDIRDAKTRDSREDSEMSKENDTIALELFTKANEEIVDLKAQAKEHGAEMEKMKKEKEETEKEAARMKVKAEEVEAAFSKGAELLDETLEGFSARITEAGAQNFFAVLAEVLGEKAAANAEVQKALDDLRAQAAQAEVDVRAAAREAKIDDLLTVEAKGMPPEFLEKIKEKQAEKKKKMMAAIDGLGDAQFDALHEVWAEQKAEADEMRRGSLPVEGGADMGRGAQKGKIATASEIDENTLLGKLIKAVSSKTPDTPAPAQAAASTETDPVMAMFKAELAKAGHDFSSVEELLQSVGGYKEVSDEESLEVLLNSVASEQTPPAGEEAPQGVDLKQAYSGLANKMLGNN